MSTIKIKNLFFKKYISEEVIQQEVKRLAKSVALDYKDEIPVFIGVLNGSFMFVSDFLKYYNQPCEISFVKFASYNGVSRTKDVSELIGVNQDLTNRSVIILEDVIDSGYTIEEVVNCLKKEKIKSLRIATLFFKKEVYTKEIPIDYVAISIADDFIVGYGLDYDQLGRNLTDVYKLKKNRMKNIVLFGPPGAGKGTQATILKEHYDLIHISTGDVFRFNIKNNTELGILAKKFIDAGHLVPDKVTINMLKAEVEKNPDAKGFIFDGFPRTESQAEALEHFLLEMGTAISGMVALEVPQDLLVERILERGKTSGRSDDQDKGKITNRFNEYQNKTSILKDYYSRKKMFFGVDGVGSVEQVSKRLKKEIDTL